MQTDADYVTIYGISKADGVASTIRVPVKELNSYIISDAPIKPIQTFMPFIRHFFHLTMDLTSTH
jgi:hypothetical protein